MDKYANCALNIAGEVASCSFDGRRDVEQNGTILVKIWNIVVVHIFPLYGNI